jgi:hypothetical protein
VLRNSVVATGLVAAAGLAACGGGHTNTGRAFPLKAPAAMGRLPATNAGVARAMVLLERGLHDGNVKLLCTRVYDPQDVGSPSECQKMVGGLSSGDDQLTIAPTRVEARRNRAVVHADVTRSPNVRERQTFELRRTRAGSWRVRLVL